MAIVIRRTLISISISGIVSLFLSVSLSIIEYQIYNNQDKDKILLYLKIMFL